MSEWKKKLDKGIAYLKRNGVRETFHRAKRKAALAGPVDYEAWLRSHVADKGELDRQRHETLQKTVQVLLFQNGEETSPETAESIKKQTCGALDISEWKGWGPAPKADYYLLVQDGSILRPEAVYQMVKKAENRNEKVVLYTDHDVIGGDGHLEQPFCKPEYDRVWQEQMNYMGTVLLVNRVLMEEVTATDRNQVWKEVTAKAEQILHLPKILVHITKDQKDDLEHSADWYDRKVLQEYPLLSVIIPSKDHVQELKNCVESLRDKGGYDNLEILIVENNSTEEETFAFYENIQKKDARVRVITWKSAFNYAAINNEAARMAAGKYLLFLNNDTKIKEDYALLELMRCAVTEGAGAVGCRLLYGDDTIQHGGVVLGYGGIAGHAFEGMHQSEYENTIYAGYIRQMSAVTAACMLVNAAAFRETGGFTEELGVAYNDIDLCMKLQKAGWMVLYDPAAQLYHYESQTRGFEMTSQKAARVRTEAEYFCRTWKKELDRGDRFYSPNLTLEKADFSLNR